MQRWQKFVQSVVDKVMGRNKPKRSSKKSESEKARKQWIESTRRPNRQSQKKRRQRARWTSK